MEIPAGMRSGGDEDMVALLKKSLYGLKQAPKEWNAMYDGWILEYGFHHASADLCLYIFVKNNHFIWVTIHVDDSIICSNSLAAKDDFKKSVGTRFKWTTVDQSAISLEFANLLNATTCKTAIH